jgi:peptidoglycan glycosyltransferase
MKYEQGEKDNMKKLEKRAIICLTIAALLIAGTVLFVVRFVNDGAKWATFYGNMSIYENGILKSGDIYDINGELLARNSDGEVIYNDDPAVRMATVHTVGDPAGNIGTSAMNTYKDKLIGYNLLTGTYKLSGRNENIKLTIDSDVCKTAYEELSRYDAGCIGIYNYKTGEIVCMVSTPSFDPENETDGESKDGMYINRFLSSKFPPGSIFKSVTAGAVLETQGKREDFSYACDGTRILGKDKINCFQPHGTVNFPEAFALSCNGAFSVLANDVGARDMKKYTEKFGLASSYDIDGIKNVPGSFEFPDNEVQLGWAGIGQYMDEVNPCSMMVYMGAIANGGKAAEPALIHKKIKTAHMTDRMMSEESADYLASMMKKAVVEQYMESNFPGLDIYAKTGTAEVSDKEPYGWFAGFIRNEDAPYAFVVCLENSGEAFYTAAPIANTVLQEAVKKSGK